MKKILLFASVVAAMASCAKTEVSDINTDSPSVISFASPYVSSKATDATNDVKSIALYATYTEGDDTKNLFAPSETTLPGTSETLALGSDDSTWSTTGTYYWPSSGEATFYGFYPTTLSYDATDALTIPAASTAKSQIDILAAYKAAKKDDGTVDITMNHILSQVDFKFTTGEGVVMNLETFSVKGIETGATVYKFSDGSMTTTTAVAAITYDESTTLSSTLAESNGGLALSTLADNEKFMLLPQEIEGADVPETVTTGSNAMATAEGACLVLEYSMSFNGLTVVGSGSTAYIPMPDITLEGGKSYVFTLKVDKDFNGGYNADGKKYLDTDSVIAFDVTVNSWESDKSETITAN